MKDYTCIKCCENGIELKGVVSTSSSFDNKSKIATMEFGFADGGKKKSSGNYIIYDLGDGHFKEVVGNLEIYIREEIKMSETMDSELVKVII